VGDQSRDLERQGRMEWLNQVDVDFRVKFTPQSLWSDDEHCAKITALRRAFQRRIFGLKQSFDSFYEKNLSSTGSLVVVVKTNMTHVYPMASTLSEN
jgi:hypothetical protein